MSKSKNFINALPNKSVEKFTRGEKSVWALVRTRLVK